MIEGRHYNLTHHRAIKELEAALRQFLIPSLIVTAIFFLFFLIRGQGYDCFDGRNLKFKYDHLVRGISGVISFAYYFMIWKKRGRRIWKRFIGATSQRSYIHLQ